MIIMKKRRSINRGIEVRGEEAGQKERSHGRSIIGRRREAEVRGGKAAIAEIAMVNTENIEICCDIINNLSYEI
jgi:hypothetical protein